MEILEWFDDPVQFPTSVVDAAGTGLFRGALVRILTDDHLDQVGEVSRWAGRRGIEVIVTDPVPELVALRSDQVLRLEAAPAHPLVMRGPAARVDRRGHRG